MKSTVLIRFKDYLIAVLLLCSQHYSATQATEKPIQTIEDFRAAAFNEGYDARLSILRSKKQTSSWIKEIDGKYSASIARNIRSALCDAFIGQGEFSTNRPNQHDEKIFEFAVTRNGIVTYDKYDGENWNALVLYNILWFMLGYGGDGFKEYIKHNLETYFDIQDENLRRMLDEQDAALNQLLKSLEVEDPQTIGLDEIISTIDDIITKIDDITRKKVEIYTTSGIDKSAALIHIQESQTERIKDAIYQLELKSAELEGKIDAYEKVAATHPQYARHIVPPTKEREQIRKINVITDKLKSKIEQYNTEKPKHRKTPSELLAKWSRSSTNCAPICKATIELLGQYLIEQLTSRTGRDYAARINEAVSDIKIYMRKLRLYDYIESMCQIRETYEKQQNEIKKIENTLQSCQQSLKAAKAGNPGYNLKRCEKAVQATREELKAKMNETIKNSVPYALSYAYTNKNNLIGKIFVIEDASVAEFPTNKRSTKNDMKIKTNELKDGKLNTSDEYGETYEELYKSLQEELQTLRTEGCITLQKYEGIKQNLRLLQAFIEFNMYGAGALQNEFENAYYSDMPIDANCSLMNEIYRTLQRKKRLTNSEIPES